MSSEREVNTNGLTAKSDMVPELSGGLLGA
jgi:hypothetical protein